MSTWEVLKAEFSAFADYLDSLSDDGSTSPGCTFKGEWCGSIDRVTDKSEKWKMNHLTELMIRYILRMIPIII